MVSFSRRTADSPHAGRVYRILVSCVVPRHSIRRSGKLSVQKRSKAFKSGVRGSSHRGNVYSVRSRVAREYPIILKYVILSYSYYQYGITPVSDSRVPTHGKKEGIHGHANASTPDCHRAQALTPRALVTGPFQAERAWSTRPRPAPRNGKRAPRPRLQTR